MRSNWLCYTQLSTRQRSQRGYSCSDNRVSLLRRPSSTRHLRRYVTDDCFRSLVVSLVHSRLDYGNFVLAGLPAYLQRQLQFRLVFRISHYDHATDVLATLYWQLLPDSVDFKVAVIAFRVQHGLDHPAPPYLNQLVRVADLPCRHRLHSSAS